MLQLQLMGHKGSYFFQLGPRLCFGANQDNLNMHKQLLRRIFMGKICYLKIADDA